MRQLVDDLPSDLAQVISPYVLSPAETRQSGPARQRRLWRRWLADRVEMHHRAHRSGPDIEHWQLQRIRAMVDLAFNQCAGYRRLYEAVGFEPGDLVDWRAYHQLPTVTRSMFAEDPAAYIAGAPLAPGSGYVSRTSGSSGLVLTLECDDEASDASAMQYLRHYELMLGRLRREEEALSEVYLAPQRVASVEGRYPTFTVSQDCPPELFAAHLLASRPAIVSGFPSYLVRMVERDDGRLREAGVQAICTNSEASTVAERELVAARLDAPVFDEYSSVEFGLMAAQCRAGRYHLVEDGVRLDVAEGATNGPVVGTSLLNWHMPLIRYEQGDAASLSDFASCDCGLTFRVLGHLSGRIDDLLRRHDGSVIPPDRVMGAYDRVFLTSDSGISTLQISQGAHGDIVVLAVRRKEADDATLLERLRALESELHPIVDDQTIQFSHKVVDALPAQGSHKRRLVTSAFRPGHGKAHG